MTEQMTTLENVTIYEQQLVKKMMSFGVVINKVYTTMKRGLLKYDELKCYINLILKKINKTKLFYRCWKSE